MELKGKSPFCEVLYHTYRKLKENVYVNKKKEKFFDGSPVMCVYYKSLPSCVHWGLGLGKLSRHESLEVMLMEKESLIFLLSPYLLSWLYPLVVISRTISLDVGSNDLLCQLVPNDKNQWWARDVIPTYFYSKWEWERRDDIAK